jgi:hypothetical protein
MKRRLFVASLSAVPALAALVSSSAAAPRRVKVLTTHVANLSAGASLSPGPWRLEREARDFDPSGVALVDAGGARLGYVPPARAAVLAALLDDGGKGFAEPAADGSARVDVFLTLGAAGDAPARRDS